MYFYKKKTTLFLLVYNKIFMNKIVSYLIYLLLFFVSFYNYTFADNNLEKVYKIESYSYDELSSVYTMEQYGSSVYLGNWLLYTNAHVILNQEDEPLWNYRVCKTINFKENAKCFSVWELLYFDTINDLAVLKVNDSENNWVKISKKDLNIWDTVKVYWYPTNWGETITYTEWKISWFEKWLYKIDANFDAGNSWWWVFDSDWDLIWMAVSVWVWYTALWYVIPIDKINNFIEKKWENIEKYDKATKNTFLWFTLWINKIIWASSFKNEYISLNNFITNWLFINDYSFNNSKKNYYLELADKNNETTISIQNYTIDWNKDYNIDDYFNSINKSIWVVEKAPTTKIVKIKKIKIKDKDAVLELLVSNENKIYLSLLIEQSKNHLVQVFINSTNIKNKSFLKWFKVILKNLEFLIIAQNENKNNYTMLLDNLKIAKNDWFYVSKNIDWWNLVNFWDISIVSSNYTKYKIKDYPADYTLSTNIIENYASMKDNYYIYNYSIKKTKKLENYIYMYGINNKTKDWTEDKTQDKYFINAFFFDKIDKENLYQNTISFSFNESKSKKEIDNLLETVETSSWEWIFPIWDLKIWENIVESVK